VWGEHAAKGSSHLYVFNNGTGTVKVSKLGAWELETASVNGGADGLVATNAMASENKMIL
jgi:beta-fructofuranosidase